jgi:hypothetical protein
VRTNYEIRLNSRCESKHYCFVSSEIIVGLKHGAQQFGSAEFIPQEAFCFRGGNVIKRPFYRATILRNVFRAPSLLIVHETFDHWRRANLGSQTGLQAPIFNFFKIALFREPAILVVLCLKRED